jgi:lipoprotein NlpI
LGDLPAAEAHIQDAATLDPGDVATACQHGNPLLCLKRYKEALHSFNDALALDPACDFAQHGRSLALHQLEQTPTTSQYQSAKPSPSQ